MTRPPAEPGNDATRPAPWLEFGLLAAAVLWLFRDVLLFGQVYYVRDIHLVWHPQVEGFVRAIASGSWPVWNTSLAFGQPLLADPSAQVLYPLTWLNLVLSPWSYYTLYVVLHFGLAAVGMRALARHLGLSRAASLVVAASFACSGPVLGMLDLWHHFAGACLMPWVVLACDRCIGGRRRDVLRFGLALALQIVAGSADMVAMTLCLAAALCAARHVRAVWPPPPVTRAALGRAASGGLLALGLSAPLWMAALEIVGRAARAGLPAGERSYWSLHPLLVVETLLPALFTGLPLNDAWRAAFFESREPLLGSLYLGVGTLALAAAGVAGRHPLRRVLLAALLLAGLVALGTHTPVYGALTTLFPPLRILRYPVKAMAAVAFCGSLLAGLGVDAWREAGPRKRLAAATGATLAIVLAGAFATGLALWLQFESFGAFLLDPAQAGRAVVLPQVLPRLLVPSALAVAVLGLVWAHSRGRLSGTRVAVATSLLAALDLAAYHRSASPVAPKALFSARPEILKALREADVHRVYVYDYTVPARGDHGLEAGTAYRLARMPEGWPIGAASALAMQMYLAPEAAGRFALSQAYSVDYRGLYEVPLERLARLLREVERAPAHVRLLQLGAVERVIALHAVAGLTPETTILGLFEREVQLQRVPEPLPRAYVAGAARKAVGDDALALLLDPGFDPRREVVLEDVARSEPAGFRGAARVVETRADRVVIETEANAAGFVVLLDGFDAGWLARLDGEPRPVLRANAVFRAVAVPEGVHRVEFVYRPRGLLLGLGVAALSLLGVIAMAGYRTGSR